MKCKQAESYFSDLLDHTLPSELMGAVSDHLSACGHCRYQLSELQQLTVHIKNLKLSEPSIVYWGTIIPRVHDRLETKKREILPPWIPRLALPLAAMMILVIFSINNYPTQVGNENEDLQSLVHQLQPEELRQLEQSESVSPGGEPSLSLSEIKDISETDKDVLKQLLQNEDHADLYVDLDFDENVLPIDDQDTDQLLSILEQQSTTD